MDVPCTNSCLIDWDEIFSALPARNANISLQIAKIAEVASS